MTVKVAQGSGVPLVIDTKEKAREYFDFDVDCFFDTPAPVTVIKVTDKWVTKPSNPVEDIAAAARLMREVHHRAPYSESPRAVSIQEYNCVGQLMQRALDPAETPLPSDEPLTAFVYKGRSINFTVGFLERLREHAEHSERRHVAHPAAVNRIVACGDALAGVTVGGKPLEVRCTLVNGHSSKHEARLTNGSGATVTWGCRKKNQ